MRLWSQQLIQSLPCIKTTKDRTKNQLGGQHRECCAMLGDGWGMKHATVNYVWNHPRYYLEAFDLLVVEEMLSRGFNINMDKIHNYSQEAFELYNDAKDSGCVIYPEHDDTYINECIDNLKCKGIAI